MWRSRTYWQISTQCSAQIERTQDADPVIKRLKVIMKEFGDVAPYKAQLNSVQVEVKSHCQHRNLLEIVNGVATRVMKDQTG